MGNEYNYNYTEQNEKAVLKNKSEGTMTRNRAFSR